MDDPKLQMARRIAAERPGTNALQRCAFLDGEWDDAPVVQAALAAIEECTERAAAHVGRLAHRDAQPICDNRARELRAFDHLKGPTA